MRAVRFYLRPPQKTKTNPKPKLSDPQAIYLKYKYRGQQLVYAVGQSIRPVNWNPEAQRVRENAITTDKDGTMPIVINTLLANLAIQVEKEYNKLLPEGTPPPAALKSALDTYMNRSLPEKKKKEEKRTLFHLLDRLIDGSAGGNKSIATVRKYQTAKKYLEMFQKERKEPIDFASINLEFKFEYEQFLQRDKKPPKGNKDKSTMTKGLSVNSVKDQFKHLRMIMNLANELKWTTNIEHRTKSFGVKGEETDGVYLTEKEIDKLYAHDFSDNPRLEKVRDFFVFNANVGLRFGDASTLQPENIVKDADGDTLIIRKTGKNKKEVAIFCTPVVLEIFEKYKKNPNRLPVISNQKYNQYIKEVCKAVGFTQVGRYQKDLKLPLYKAVASHTARRSYITNLHKRGIDATTIKRATGHSPNSQSFGGYIKESAAEAAKRMGNDLSKQKLKAVS